MRGCLEPKKNPALSVLTFSDVDSRRIGNFWLDSPNFKRETDITGWSFSALILFVDNLVVYTLYGGQPRVHEKETARNPLGPLQGWGDQMPTLMGF